MLDPGLSQEQETLWEKSASNSYSILQRQCLPACRRSLWRHLKKARGGQHDGHRCGLRERVYASLLDSSVCLIRFTSSTWTPKAPASLFTHHPSIVERTRKSLPKSLGDLEAKRSKVRKIPYPGVFGGGWPRIEESEETCRCEYWRRRHSTEQRHQSRPLKAKTSPLRAEHHVCYATISSY